LITTGRKVLPIGPCAGAAGGATRKRIESMPEAYGKKVSEQKAAHRACCAQQQVGPLFLAKGAALGDLRYAPRGK
jgi:hypothetical protein